MSIEKAIEEISKMQFEHRDYRSAIFKKDGIPLMYIESVDLAIEALKKQMPAKIEKSNTRAYGYCPECGKVFWDKWENEYCESCGQKLDWSEV